MTRKATLVAVVAVLAMGTSAALAFGAGPHATSDASMAQETTTMAEETTTVADETTAAGQQTTVAGGAAVTFENQTSNGTTVVVQQVVVPEGGFVVIHAAENATPADPAENETEFEGVTQTETATGTEMATETTVATETTQQYTAGEVLGNSTYLEPGTHENVTVQLDTQLEESQVLIAMPHRDTNDNQQYDFPEADAPYTQDGQPVTDWAFVTVDGEMVETTAAAAGEDEQETETATEEGTETTTAEM